MRALLASRNALFAEVVARVLCDNRELEITVTEPSQAAAWIAANRPEVIIVDRGVDSACLEQMILATGTLTRSRLIVLETGDNNFQVIDSHTGTLTAKQDLLEIIRETGHAA